MGRQRASQRARQSKGYRTELRRFGLLVRTHRLALQLTLEQAAERMDLDVTHLTKIEGGTINVTFATIVRIARGLEMSVPELLIDP